MLSAPLQPRLLLFAARSPKKPYLVDPALVALFEEDPDIAKYIATTYPYRRRAAKPPSLS